jgi:lipid-A-disaccharide synthase
MAAAPTVFLIAAEESGDRLGAALIQALGERCRGSIAFAGVGGRAMAEQGLTSLLPIDELAIVGLTSIPRRAVTILRTIRAITNAVVAARPDVLVIIDSPDLTHRIARRVRTADPALPIVDYVCPSVWAWRPGRARAMRHYIDHVLALLPFEPAELRRLGGPACTFVGHPLAEEVTKLRPGASEAHRRLADPPVVLALPGSRSSEIRRHARVFGQALGLVREQVGAIEVVVPSVAHHLDLLRATTADWPVPPRIVSGQADKHAAFRMARAALAKSGTVTLELALAAVPMVAAYRVSAFEALVAQRMVRVPSYILANLVLGGNVVPELLQDDCRPERLAAALVALISGTSERERQLAAFAQLDRIMRIGTEPPAARAADVVLSLLRRRDLAFADVAAKL